MSMPNVVHPWSFTPPAATEVRPAPAVPGLARYASALFAAGFVRSASALAESEGGAELSALACSWQQTTDLDAAVTSMIVQGAGVIVPSVSVLRDGSPRFVLQTRDAELAAAAIAQEHGSDGVAAELRLFLDEALRNGDRYVDAAPGAGFAALSAATGTAAVSVIALCEDEAHRASIEASARWSAVPETVIAHTSATLDAVSFAAPMHGCTTILHAGDASCVAPLLTGARIALERRQIGAVAWRCGRADDTGRDAEGVQIAAAVLGLFGFEHFALAEGETGMELVPADAMASNEMIFSLEPSFLARFAA
jgi:hypothetical protein